MFPIPSLNLNVSARTDATSGAYGGANYGNVGSGGITLGGPSWGLRSPANPTVSGARGGCTICGALQSPFGLILLAGVAFILLSKH